MPGICGIGLSVRVGDIEATNGFVVIDAPVTGDGEEVVHAFNRD